VRGLVDRVRGDSITRLYGAPGYASLPHCSKRMAALT
jgi:hypothetical protein